ncbi:15-hydroxyprostaglandin dehydrogenase [NAD(+)]-like [Adelges cooleyi]|uniref:15-hydroxyprostaglandin dehydrogenase [NAD(+)]-like n=1 Tax=Adelges cooleyi TaxID=133065 RepID=UPI00217F6480|nr:15-hydroxyprostaglandin dehydrogenase [NAD(+)]-like [Adelges cooleyi]
MIFKDQVALVTGGASGIGFEYVKCLLQNGVKVAVSDINFQACKTATEHFAVEYGNENVIPVQCDVTDDVQFENAFKTCIEKYGKLDIIINNAGVMDNSLVNWSNAVNVNYGGVVRGTMLAIKYMGKAYGGTGGTVVQTASILAYDKNMLFFPVYSSTKKAVVEFTKALGDPKNFDLHGIRMLSICPGFTRTPLAVDVNRSTFWHEDNAEEFYETQKRLSYQEAEHVGKALIEILEHGKSGESWIVENTEPPKLVV